MKKIHPVETHKKTINRDKILNVSSNIFTRKGFENTTINDIADAVEKKKSSVYYYFKSKEEIFQNVVLDEAVKFRREIIEAIDNEINPIEKFKVYIITRMKIINVYQNFYLTLKNDNLSHIKFFKRLNSIYDKEEIRLFKNILTAGVKNNYLKQNFDISLAAEAIIMAIKGIESSFFAVDKEIKFESKIENIIEILLFGIAVKNN
jgi:AcrR family transcriptional regulator